MKKISIIIPVFNNAESIKILHQEITQILKAHTSPLSYQMIFINDGSTDTSLEILKEVRAQDSSVMVIEFSRNFGQMAGILAGWDLATGDAIINMSADLQDPPSQIALMLQEWEKGNEIVINYRNSRVDSWINVITSKIAYSILKESLPEIPKGGFDFTLLDKKVLEAIKQIKEKNRFFQGDILWVGFKIKYLPYNRLERKFGKSGYSFSKRFGNFLVAYLNISYTPIRIMSLIGFMTSFSGLLYATTVVYSYFVHQTPFKGWAPIMMVLLIMGGIIMVMLGVIGEYIWRIYDEVKRRPNYIIRNIL
jgi:polyisoprenyl-phosphate glycosyltransferase